MRNVVALAVGIFTLVGLAASADARLTHYRSQHPLPRKIAHGFCYIEVPHAHGFEPGDRRLYREMDGHLYFVGDPTPFAYQGPQYTFYGAHPIVEAHVPIGEPVYCYLGGPHSHWYQPPPDARFDFRGGAYWYVGNFEPAFHRERPRYMVVNDAYRPLEYARPVVDVTVAPPGFQGDIVVSGPGWRGRAAVGAPMVGASVQLAAPPPPVLHVGVGLNLGGPSHPAVVQHRHVHEVRERHDRGQHRGWHKQRDGAWRGKPQPAAPAGWRAQPAQGGGWRAQPPAAKSWRQAPPAAQRSDRHGGQGEHQRGGGWRR